MSKRLHDGNVDNVRVKRPRHFIDEADFFACNSVPADRPLCRYDQLPLNWLDAKLCPRPTATTLATMLTPLLFVIGKINRSVGQIIASYAATPDTLVAWCHENYQQLSHSITTDVSERLIVNVEKSLKYIACQLMVHRPLTQGVHRFTVRADPPVTRDDLGIGIGTRESGETELSTTMLGESALVARDYLHYGSYHGVQLTADMYSSRYRLHRSMTCEIDLTHGTADGLIRFIVELDGESDEGDTHQRTHTFMFRRSSGFPVFMCLNSNVVTKLTVTLESSVYSA